MPLTAGYTFPLPPDEPTRLARLRELLVLDTPSEPLFDAIAQLASVICGTPIALLSLVDADRQWFKANVGLDGVQETGREVAFCAHAIGQEGVMVVPDATTDPRFASNGLVTGDPRIRFYAGAPLAVDGGARVGTLCVIDREPRTMDAGMQQRLRALAAIASTALDMRRELIQRSLALRGDFEQRLSSAEMAARTLLDSQDDLLVLLDAQGLVQSLNVAAASHVQAAGDDLVGARWSDLVEPSIRPGMDALVGAASHAPEGTTSWSAPDSGMVWTARRVSGPDRPVQIALRGRSLPVDANASMHGRTETTAVPVQLAADDEATRQPLPWSALRAQRERRRLAVEQARLRQSLKSAEVITWAWNHRRRQLRVDGVVCSEVAVPDQPQEAARNAEACGLLSAMSAASRRQFDSLCTDTAAGLAGDSMSLDLQLETAEGLRLVHVTGRRLHPTAPGGSDLVGLLRDVTPQRQAERALLNSERLFRTIADNAPSIISRFDRERRHLYVNRRVTEVTGMTPEHFVGKTNSDLGMPVESSREWDAMIDQALAGQQVQASFTFTDPTGKQRHFEATVLPERDDDDQVVSACAISHDVTAFREREQLMRDRAAFAEQLMGIVSHDLRSPMSSIHLATEVLRRQPTVQPEQQRLLDRIAAANGRAQRLVTDLLDFTQARLGSGLSCRIGPMDLEATCQQALDEARFQHPSHVFEFRASRATARATSPPGGGPHGDPHRLQQMLGNLLANAVAYGDPKRPVMLSLDMGSDRYSLAVRNWGTPIPPALRGRLFEAMVRGNSEPSAQRSVGLGLYIVHQIVMAHGGDVSVESSAALGTTFTATLPQVPAASA